MAARNSANSIAGRFRRRGNRATIAIGALTILAIAPAHAATPGPDCTVRQVVETEVRHFDPRHAGTLGQQAAPRAAATVRQQSAWKARLPVAGSATTGG